MKLEVEPITRKRKRKKRSRTRLLEDELDLEIRPKTFGSKFTSDMVQRLLGAASLIPSHRELAWAVGVDPSTLFKWKQKHPDLRILIEEQKSETKNALVKLEIDQALTAKGRDARVFILRHLHPDFRTRTIEEEDEEEVMETDVEDLDFTYL